MRRHRLARRRRGDRQPGAAVPLLLRPVRPGDDPGLQGGVVPPAAGLRDPAHPLARHRRAAGDGPGRGRPLVVAVADDVRPARHRRVAPRAATPRSRWPGGSSGSPTTTCASGSSTCGAAGRGLGLSCPTRTCAGTRSAATTTSARSTWTSSGGAQGRRPVQRRADRAPAQRTRGGRVGARGRHRVRRQARCPRASGECRVSEPHDRSARARSWPLWEVFVRGKRGLSHIHVGLAARARTPRWRCATPATSTPAARRASRIWVVPGRRHHRVQPGREGRVLRPGRRQGLPAPDLLRRARGGGAPVMTDDSPAADSLVAHRTLCGSATTRWSPRSGWASGSPRPADRGGHRAGQHRPRPARPGARAADLRRVELDGTGRTEDDLAYLRDEREFRNVQLVEQPSAATSASRWPGCCVLDLPARAVRRAASPPTDEVLAGVAAKAVKEVDYHLDHATQWVLRLGDGTEESHRRMQAALDAVGRTSPSCSRTTPRRAAAAAEPVSAVLPSSLRPACDRRVARCRRPRPR